MTIIEGDKEQTRHENHVPQFAAPQPHCISMYRSVSGAVYKY